jgi:hypothetical protein
MNLVYRGTTAGVRSPFSFTVSGCVHSGLLAWVILAGQPLPKALSIYDQEIRPNEKKIVWYNLKEKLPEISPTETQADARPPRARVKAPQTMVAGARDDASPAPLIWAPEPEVTAPKTMPLPNVVAVAPPKIVRPFVAPPEADRSLTVAAPMELPDAPKAAVKVTEAKMEMVKPSGPLRAFTPPPEVRMQRQALLALPESPQAEMVVDPGALPFAVTGPRPPPRAFVPPPTKAQTVAAVNLPSAP